MKRRAPKRRLDEAAELVAWWEMFDVSCDFFGEVAELTGLREPGGIVPFNEREEVFAAWEAATQDAWARLGAAFLRQWTPTDVRQRPWALEQFGEPPCR